MMYRLGHWGWPRILALHNILPCRFLKRPHYRLRRCALQLIWDRVHAIAMDRYDDEMVLFLSFLRDGQAEDLIYVFPCNGEFYIAVRAYCAYATVLLVQ
jgi:hypothetical protein